MTCDDYFEDPEKNASHLATCAECRVMAEELAAPAEVTSHPIAIGELPLAPWEGATHRTWPLVIVGALSVLILTVALFLAAGTPPLRGIARALTANLASFEAASKFFQHFGNGLHSAPALVHVTIGVLFVVINTILVFLLRRAPRGIDV